MFSRCGRLLEIAGQPSRAIGQRSERRLDAPAQRERLEPFCIPLSGRDLDVEVVGCCGLRHPRTDVDSIDLDPLQDPAVLDRPVEQQPRGLRVVYVGRLTRLARTKPSEQVSTW